MPKRRQTFIINKRFQLKFSAYICSWIFALSLIYPLIIYNLFEYFLKHAGLVEAATIEALQASRSDILALIVAMQALFLGITLLISFFTSHRIAGPLYKLNKYMREAASGDLKTDLTFRKSDHFKELAVSYNEMASSIAATRDAAIKELEEAMKHSDQTGQQHLQAAIAKLRDSRAP